MRQSKYEDGMTEGEYIEAHRPERIKNKQVNYSYGHNLEVGPDPYHDEHEPCRLTLEQLTNMFHQNANSDYVQIICERTSFGTAHIIMRFCNDREETDQELNQRFENMKPDLIRKYRNITTQIELKKRKDWKQMKRFRLYEKLRKEFEKK